MHNKLELIIKILGEFFESLEQPVAIIDEEGKFVYYNRFDAEIDEMNINDVLGGYVLDTYPNLNEDSSTMLRSLNYGEKFFDQHQIYHTRSGKIVDYIHTTLPIYDENRIIGVIEIGRDIGKIKELTNKVLDLSAKLYSQENEDIIDAENTIITRNIRMKQLIKELDIYAQSDFPILVCGETGTGKELFVKRAHKKSQRSDRAFISLNCAAIPDTLLESILFGTTKGAFTGAENRKGLFEIADKGTLFLDELNSMPITTQAKLLRAIQEGQIMKLGTTTPINVDVRVIAAMNEDPNEAVEHGHLREDLLYRLSVGLISIPPLHFRKDDISLLADYFVKRYSRESNRNIRLINPRIMRQMEQHDWPGNVRMLENVIKRSIMLEDPDNIALNELHFIDDNTRIYDQKAQSANKKTDSDLPNVPMNTLVDNYEKDLITKALLKSKGNVKKAARLLQIPRTTLQYKIKKYHLLEMCIN